MNARDHTRYADDSGAYLLGALHDLERQAFESHLAVCVDCREEVDRLRPAADALPRSATPLVPPPGLKRSLMDVVEREAAERRPAPVRRPLGKRLGALVPSVARARPAFALAAAALLLLAIGVAGGVGIGQLGSGDDVQADRTLSASVDHTRLPSASARLVVPAGGARGGILHVRNLPVPRSERVYQVWIRRGKEVTPGPTFLPHSNGSGAAAVTGSLKGVDEVMVTREHRGGAPQPTEQPLIHVNV
jgi:anti-sigma-K factor RskA